MEKNEDIYWTAKAAIGLTKQIIGRTRMDKKLPVGIQSFEKIRKDGFLYVDKTEYVYRLAHNNVPYFLSRPRRFGKSLLLSTIKAFFEGKKELFEGLEIEKLEKDNPDAWKKYPVFYFDFNGEEYENVSIEEMLDQHLCEWEEVYGDQYHTRTLGYRFQKLLEMATKKTGLRCVVLVDEYDKPLLEAIEDKEREEHIKKVFKGFFSRLKKADEYIQFIFITGVSKFHKVSIFSDLNQLSDISLNKEYASVCGITEEEVRKYFSNETEILAKHWKMSFEECLNTLKKQYDGYRFHPDDKGVYNPYSLLSAYFAKEFGSFRFESGTPTWLISRVRERSFDVRKFTDKTLYASEAMLKDYTGDNMSLIPLLYQTGYLTIEEYDERRKRYTLCFTNEEVKYGFLESLMPSYVPETTAGNGLDIYTLDEYVENGDLNGVRDFLTAMFANITYTIQDAPFEHYFQSVIYVIFKLLGKFTVCELQTYNGRIDCKVETKSYIYLFEFKRDDTAGAALAQIDCSDYALPFVADSRELYKIGVSFDSSSRELVDWEVAKA